MTNRDKKDWGILGAIGAGFAASACCAIPLALVSLGVGGSFVGFFVATEPFRPVFIGIAVLALGYAGLKEFERSRVIPCECEGELSEVRRRSLLAAGFFITLGLIASPWIIPSSSDHDSNMAAEELEGLQQVVLNVAGMSCELCNITVSTALTNLEGVQEAVVTFEPPQAVVQYNPSLVSILDMEIATSEIGYPATRKQAAP